MTEQSSIPAGTCLHWFKFESVLGRGGFGVTYLARDRNLQQYVAIKEYMPQLIAARGPTYEVLCSSSDEKDIFSWGLSRFIAEARTLAHFCHPHIVSVRTVFEANNTAYMVMDYEQGETLSALIRRKRVRSEEHLRELVEPVMSGLVQVHHAGFIHRDIKPSNIIIRDSTGPVLIDFGAARTAIQGATQTMTALATPHFSPFEQYTASREVDRQGPWTDVYGLCATMYFAITGRAPVDAATRADRIIHDGADPYEPLAAVRPAGFSLGLCQAIDNGLTFRPNDRIQNVAQLSAELSGWSCDLEPSPATRQVEIPRLEAKLDSWPVGESDSNGVELDALPTERPPNFSRRTHKPTSRISTIFTMPTADSAVQAVIAARRLQASGARRWLRIGGAMGLLCAVVIAGAYLALSSSTAQLAASMDSASNSEIRELGFSDDAQNGDHRTLEHRSPEFQHAADLAFGEAPVVSSVFSGQYDLPAAEGALRSKLDASAKETRPEADRVRQVRSKEANPPSGLAARAEESDLVAKVEQVSKRVRKWLDSIETSTVLPDDPSLKEGMEAQR